MEDSEAYIYPLDQWLSCNLSSTVRSELQRIMQQSYKQYWQDIYSKPMPWIGMYIAFASLLCVLAIAADLLHGFWNRKLWFPCRYFTINAASITVIAVAMKLPVDLTTPMEGRVDLFAKMGSMAFMCTMMANLLPSLATMDSKELLTNVIALVVLVITLIVNICIEITTGVIYPYVFIIYSYVFIIYVIMLLMLLIIHTCSAFTVVKSKRLLELKYQASHKAASGDLESQQSGTLTVEVLKQQVTKYWIMAETGNPQFISSCSATTSASGVICALSTVIYGTATYNVLYYSEYYSQSDYKWSIIVILMIQFVGVLLGTIAPLCRCFAALSFKFSLKWIRNHIKVFVVESYWTQKLCDWKQSSIPFSISNRKIKIVIENFKILVLRICIGFQKSVVVACKMIALIPIPLVLCVFSCIHCWRWIKAMFSTLSIDLVRNPNPQENNQDYREYILQLQEDMEVAERTLKGISKSLNRLIQKAEKQQPKKLIQLLNQSCGFEGVGKYDRHIVPLLSDCWSLPLVTLTTIIISLPNIQNSKVDTLLSSVSEGLAYVRLVEEMFNVTDERVKIQKATKHLWLEVEVGQKWLGNKLKNTTSQTNTTRQILEWFRDRAKSIVTEVLGIHIEVSNENLVSRSICSYSMYCIAESILHSHQDDINEVTHQKLFEELSLMIADILAACLTNLPQVIVMKCHERATEKREASVHAAAQLLGETKEIINSLQKRQLPSFNQDEWPFIDMWRAYFQHYIP